ncbi:pilus assembly FimT family protein [Methylobacillus flagellatus]|uniref:pilus assembly FimT family protein n=1 Tax=Methylobacillus flagellatus TaxID=405 RepID=UPI0010F61618|nr:type II secretion system protein [Methylobacillus flagellatus]
MRTAGGYTLIELVVVIVITSILAVVLVPRFIGRDAFDARGAHDTLLASLRYAQKLAIAQRTTVYANLNTSTRQLCLGYNSDCSAPVLDPRTQSAYVRQMASSVVLTASTAVLGFDGLGRPVPNAAASYSVSNSVDLSMPTRTINVTVETGHVQ